MWKVGRYEGQHWLCMENTCSGYADTLNAAFCTLEYTEVFNRRDLM